MILEEGKEYTRDEIMEFMGISLEVWNHNKNKLLDNLANYYEFEINYNDSKQNIKWTYRIVKKLGEYYPIERKTKKRKEFETLLEKTIKEIVAEDDLQSAANITRLISKFEDCHKDKFAAFGYSEGYLYELVRIKLKEMYGEYKISFGKVGYIEDRVSCVANVDDCIYTPLNEKERKFLYDAYSKRRNENTE